MVWKTVLLSILGITTLMGAAGQAYVVRPLRPEHQLDTPALGISRSQLAVAQEMKISAPLIAQLLNNAIQGTQARFHNLGSRQGNSWHQAQASFIRLPAVFGNLQLKFDIPEVAKSLDCGSQCPNLGTVKFYVNQFNLQTAELKYVQPEFRLRLSFEEDGTEVKTFLLGPLQWVSDRTVPDIEINQARLDLYLRPIAQRGALTYQVTRSNFEAEIQATGACTIAGQDICSTLFDYKKFLATQIETQSRKLLNDPNLRDRVSTLLSPQLTRLGIRTVEQVRIDGDQLVMMVQR